MKNQQFINGVWQDAGNGGTWEVLNPATETMVAQVAFGDAADAHAAIDAAHAAFLSWSKRNAWERAEILKRVASLMRERVEALAEITVAEAGKPRAEARGEWIVAAQFFEWFAEEGKRAYGQVIPANRNNKRMSVILQPIGAVGIITAWNFPVWNAARVWAASLAAGCTFVAKPSEFTPLTAMALMGVLEEAGVPQGAANLVLGDAAGIGQALLDRPEVRKIHFVGSTRVGKLLMDGASKTNTKLSLELGGNAPAIIFPDADLDTVIHASAVAKCRNCGQVCVSPQRFLVHRSIYERFAETVGASMRGLKVGNGTDPETQVGPLINRRQRDQIAEIVAKTVAEGAEVLAGARIPEGLEQGYFYAPTVLKNVTPQMTAFRQEMFGPVMTLTPFDTLEEALSLANDTEYGLAAYVWTNDLNTAIRMSEGLEFGIVGINEWAAHGIEAPFGGWKQSGLGYECGEEGLLEYLEKKLISIGGL